MKPFNLIMIYCKVKVLCLVNNRTIRAIKINNYYER